MNPHKELALKCLRESIGDDLYRARTAFGYMSDDQMQEQHGQSSKTRQQILDGYIKHEQERIDAIKWLEGVAE